MPLYEYKCSSCGVKFERMERMNDNENANHDCPGGGVSLAYRLISTSALKFVGAGFYVNDYKKP